MAGALGGSGDGEYGPQENTGLLHCGRGAASKVIVCVDVVFLGVLVGKGIANAAIAPANAPKRANSTFLVVYENAIPTMLIVRGESTASTSFVAKPDRKRVRKPFASSCCFLSALAYDGHFKSKGNHRKRPVRR